MRAALGEALDFGEERRAVARPRALAAAALVRGQLVRVLEHDVVRPLVGVGLGLELGLGLDSNPNPNPNPSLTLTLTLTLNHCPCVALSSSECGAAVFLAVGRGRCRAVR